MGATAASTLIGPDSRVLRDRGLFFDLDAVGLVMPTVHPASVLRIDSAARSAASDTIVADLRTARARLADLKATTDSFCRIRRRVDRRQTCLPRRNLLADRA